MDAEKSKLIEVKSLSRTFRSAIKEEGLRGSLRLLMNPQYRTVEALKNVSFQIEAGAFIGLIGANGAGKTTLLKILSGLIPASSGTATVLGFTPFERDLEFRKQISLVMGQKAQLWWDLPAVDAFELLRAIYEIPSTEYRRRLDLLTELLDVGRHLHTQIRRLSLGERMKMELIGALLHWPKVIFLDEPTIGLDVLAAHRLREFLRVFNEREGATILLTSHNMDDIERLCPCILILKMGELIYEGPPSKLTAKGERTLRVRFMQCPTEEELSRSAQLPLQRVQFEGASGETGNVFFSVHQEEIVPVLQRLMNHFPVVDMGIEEQSLERVIQRLYEGGP